jgi:hypothetical protein
MKASHSLRALYLLVGLGAAPALAAPASPSVCDRTPQVRDLLVNQIGRACDEIDDADLLTVQAVRLNNSGLTSLRAGDFNGLRRLEVLNVKRNAITVLPHGIFTELASLRVLVILGNQIAQIPDDFTVGNPNLEKIHMFANPFPALSPRVLDNLGHLPKLNLLDISKDLAPTVQQTINATFPRENETVTVVFN